MADQKIIAVVGATGAQGGGLANAILEDPSSGFAVRAITRNIDGDVAKALRSRGAEVVRADVDDVASLERAFQGAYGAYCVTFFWAHLSPEKEQAEAKNMAQAAKTAGLQHVVWSTLEDTRKWVPLEDTRMPTLMGRYKVPHFDAKAEVDHVFPDAGLQTTFLRASFYWDNLYMFGMGPKKAPDGSYTLTLPMGKSRLAGIAADDIGRCALGVFRRGRELAGKTVGIAGEYLTGDEMAATLSKVLGIRCRYVAIPADAYRKLGFPGAEELGNMFQIYDEHEKDFLAARPLDLSRSLNPKLQTFEEWVRRNAKKIPLGS